jgi:geranylgeranylglycerol-phosphate geranylgeranyltransferase
MLITKLDSYLQLIRLENTLLVSVYAFLGAYLSVGLNEMFSTHVFIAAVVVSLTTAFGNAINDYFDVEVDRLGKPDRPIPAGRISRSSALKFSVLLVFATLGIACFLGFALFIFALFTLVLTALYSIYFKGTILIGNITTAFLIALIPMFGALVTGEINVSIWVACTLLFLFTFAQEVLYDVEDIEGDRQAAIQTTATYFGASKSLLIYKLIVVIFVIAACIPWFVGWVSNWYFFSIIPCSIIPILWITYILRGEISSKTMHRAVYGSWYICFTSIIPLILMNV